MSKYTDEQIKKGLECCCISGCMGCPFRCGSESCMDELIEHALDLINRREAEIERLKEKNR